LLSAIDLRELPLAILNTRGAPTAWAIE
jgi:hypothetical protein